MTVSRTRAIAVVVIVVAFIALAAFALLARAYEPGRNGVAVPDGSLGLSTPRLAQPIAASSSVASVVAGVTQDAPNTPSPLAPMAPAAPAAPPANGGVQLAACELGLPVPTRQAGLANLVGLVPLFGPFAPEAFAMMPAFQPAFPLFGPMIVAGGEQLDAHASELDALISVLHPLQTQGFDTIGPLYGPYRPQFLAAESQLASTLQPGVEAFAAAPGATCVPAALALLFS
jgi:hypothetical protein